MALEFSIGIVGPGRLGRALAENIAKAGYDIREIVFHNAKNLKRNFGNLPRPLRGRATTIDQASFNTDVVWLCVPDSQIENVAQSLRSVTKWKGKAVFHSSGALTSDVLQPLRKSGASVASVHPLMTFVHDSKPSLKGIPFGIEGDAKATGVARQIIKNLGAGAFVVKKQNKALYHAWGTLLSPLLLSYLVAAEQVARAIGISPKAAREKMLPIANQTLNNYAAIAPAAAFSGPLVRGDADVVRQHLKALEGIPEAREIYIASAKSALRHLPVRNRKQLEKLLKG